MSLVSTKTPIFDDVPSIEFFNGRLLSGEDMTTEQAWNAARRKLLGQALGSGVALGLEVRISEKSEHAGKPIVSVDPGLALNAGGEVLSLAEPTDVSLAKVDESEAVPAEFSSCLPTQYSAYVKSDGVYLLTLCPAAGTQGRAPVSGLANQEARCNRKYRREGVQFRLHQLKLTEAELADRNRLRNVVAYKCFDPDAWQTFVTDPFAAPAARPKLLDGLLVPKLEDSEVPLATVFWTTDGGIEHVDLWSVRRRPAIPPADPVWFGHLEPWAAGESGARLQQLHAQLFELAAQTTDPAAATATTYLRYVPAAGVVPVTGSGAPHGFRPNVFFGSLVREAPRTIGLADAVGLVASASAQLPIDLQSVARLYLYWVSENLEAVDAGHASRRYMLYSTEPAYPIDESVRKCLLDAASAYAGLLAQGKFVPADGVAPVRTIVQLGGLVERIVQAASGGTSMLYRASDLQIIAAFQVLYGAQADFVAFLASPALGTGNVDRRQEFVSLISKPLNEDQGTAVLSLNGAIAQINVKAAVIAQNRITAIVLGHSGEVTVGNLQVEYRGEADGRGETLVKGATDPYHYKFVVYNKTNRTLDVDLEARFRDPRESWNDSVSIVGGPQLLAIAPFNPAQPDDPRAFREVLVAVTTPDAEEDETGILDFIVRVSGEESRFDSDFVELTIGLEETPGDTVRFDGAPVLEGGNPDNAPIGQWVSYSLAYRFHGDTGQGRDFKITVECTVDAATAQLFQVDFSADEPPIPVLDAGASTDLSRVSAALALASDQPGTFRVDVKPKTGAGGKVFKYRVHLASVDGSVEAIADELTITAA